MLKEEVFGAMRAPTITTPNNKYYHDYGSKPGRIGFLIVSIHFHRRKEIGMVTFYMRKSTQL